MAVYLENKSITLFGDSIGKGITTDSGRPVVADTDAVKLFEKEYGVKVDNKSVYGNSIKKIVERGIMPLSFNVCVYIGIGMAIAKWNDFQGPLIYLKSDANFTVAVAFYYHFGASGDSSLLTNVKMAMAVCMTVVPAILFFLFQKQMIGGVKIGGIKG